MSTTSTRGVPARRSRSRALAGAAALGAGLLLCSLGAAAPASAEDPPFRDPSLPLAVRVDDLVGRLTTAEKISLLHQYSPAVPRLDIPAFRTGTEALHGVAWLGEATVFPQAIGLGSTWDPELLQRVGDAVGQEARGFHVQDPDAHGLNLWAPVVDLLRDPRAGRNEEGYSEDPYLTGEISTAYTLGLSGDDPLHLQTAPTLKHYTAYNNEVHRDVTSSVVPEQLLRDYYQEAFRPALEAGTATGVMPAYNLVDGRPNTVDPELDSLVRSWAPLPLMIVTDAGAPSGLTGAQDYFDTPAQAHAAAVQAGIDSFTDNSENPEPTREALAAAVEQGLLSEAEVDDAVGHVLSVRFRLGDFDPEGTDPYADITPDVIGSPEHQRLAREAAAAQMVLLENDDDTLPLDAASAGDVAVVGPLGDTLYEDWYSGTMPYEVTPLDGITERVGAGADVTTAEGVDRIALQDTATGRFLTAGADEDGAALAATGDSAGADQSFDVTDWGEGVVTLRAAANGQYLSLAGDRTLVNDQEQPNGWYVQQQFMLETRDDGQVVLRYAGNEVSESWFGPARYAVVGDDGVVRISAATPEEATGFTQRTLVDGVQSAARAAAQADTAVVVVGSMPFINGREVDDRQSTALPERQQALISAVQEANPRTVVVLEDSYPTTMPQVEDVPTLLWTSHAGQETGHGLADVLFGDSDPRGRLTQTWYTADTELPSILDYDISKTGMTYQYFEGDPLYPFGYGQSYATFEHSDLRLDHRRTAADGTVQVSVDVTNTSDRDGSDVVQLYTRQRGTRVDPEAPDQQLQAFARVEVPAHTTRTATLELDAEDLAHWDVSRGRPVVANGLYDVVVGSDAEDQSLRATLAVAGEVVPPRDLSTTTQAESFDDYSGVSVVDASRTAGNAVSATEAGQWVLFRDVALQGAGSVTARVSRAQEGEAAVEVRLGSPTGRLLGTVPVPSTGSRYAWEEQTASLAPAGGRLDVYLVFTGAAQVDELSFS